MRIENFRYFEQNNYFRGCPLRSQPSCTTLCGGCAWGARRHGPARVCRCPAIFGASSIFSFVIYLFQTSWALCTAHAHSACITRSCFRLRCRRPLSRRAVCAAVALHLLGLGGLGASLTRPGFPIATWAAVLPRAFSNPPALRLMLRSVRATPPAHALLNAVTFTSLCLSFFFRPCAGVALFISILRLLAAAPASPRAVGAVVALAAALACCTALPTGLGSSNRRNFPHPADWRAGWRFFGCGGTAVAAAGGAACAFWPRGAARRGVALGQAALVAAAWALALAIDAVVLHSKVCL